MGHKAGDRVRYVKSHHMHSRALKKRLGATALVVGICKRRGLNFGKVGIKFDDSPATWFVRPRYLEVV